MPDKPFKDALIEIVNQAQTSGEFFRLVWKAFPDWRGTALLPFQDALCKEVHLEGNRCPLCDILQVLRPNGWELTLGKTLICIAETFMEKGELIKPNADLPKHLNRHRGYHVLRYMGHLIAQPASCDLENESTKEAKKGNWAPTVDGLEFLYMDDPSPRSVYVLKRAVLGVSQMGEAERSKCGGEVPADDVVSVGDVMRMKGFDISAVRAMNITDPGAWSNFWETPTLPKRALGWKGAKKAWLLFWSQHVNKHGGWKLIMDIRRQQGQWAADNFEAEFAKALDWRERFYPLWKSLKERGVDFYGTNEN